MARAKCSWNTRGDGQALLDRFLLTHGGTELSQSSHQGWHRQGRHSGVPERRGKT